MSTPENIRFRARSTRAIIAITFSFFLGACVSSPDVTIPVRTAGDGAQWYSMPDAADRQAVDNVWWNAFDDPVLNELIERSISNGFDVRKSQARLREAQAVGRQVRSALWPTVSATGSYTWTEQSVNSPSGPSSLIQAGFIDRDLEFWGADLGAQWDVDLFGANRFANRSALAQIETSRAVIRGVALATIARVALGYVQYNAINQRLRILTDTVASQSDSLDVLRKMLAIGLESQLNIDRAAGQLAANRAGLPTLTAQRRQAVFQLVLLTGQETGKDVAELESVLSKARELASADMAPAMGVKSDLLTRRPDVAVAQYQLFSAGAEVGQAKAELLPKLVIGASSGYSSGSTSTLFDSASRALAVAPSVTMPLFNRGRLKAAREAAYARYDFALAHYEQTVLNAFIDAETQWLNLNATRESAQFLDDSARNNRAAFERARKLYDRGLLSYLEVLDAQRQQLSAEDAAVQGKARLDLALVQLYVSLGGGWQITDTGLASAP